MARELYDHDNVLPRCTGFYRLVNVDLDMLRRTLQCGKNANNHPLFYARFDVTSFAESGFNGYAVVNSLSIAAPGKTSKALTNNIYRTIVEVLKLPDIAAQIHAMAIDISGITPDHSRAYINTQVKMWEGVMQAAGIRRSE